MDSVAKSRNYKSVKEFRKTIFVSDEEFLWRTLKDILLAPFGYTYGDIMYKCACRKKQKKTNNKWIKYQYFRNFPK